MADIVAGTRLAFWGIAFLVAGDNETACLLSTATLANGIPLIEFLIRFSSPQSVYLEATSSASCSSYLLQPQLGRRSSDARRSG